ncbi:hypothetical protein Scep_028570 [Stephania cephalantha]|uniref:Uncharacterized protein n=1 Tax=Stephania cephalantha TaxID=152367 RepID=A0AAP0HI96_9MAGN
MQHARPPSDLGAHSRLLTQKILSHHDHPTKMCRQCRKSANAHLLLTNMHGRVAVSPTLEVGLLYSLSAAPPAFLK